MRSAYEARVDGELTIALADAWHNILQHRSHPTALEVLNAPAAHPTDWEVVAVTEVGIVAGVYTMRFAPPHVGQCMLVYTFEDDTPLVQVRALLCSREIRVSGEENSKPPPPHSLTRGLGGLW
jgi:hypothetical protein